MHTYHIQAIFKTLCFVCIRKYKSLTADAGIEQTKPQSQSNYIHIVIIIGTMTKSSQKLKQIFRIEHRFKAIFV